MVMCVAQSSYSYSNDMEIWPTATAHDIISILLLKHFVSESVSVHMWVCDGVDFMRLHRNDDDVDVNVTGKWALIKMFLFSKEGEHTEEKIKTLKDSLWRNQPTWCSLFCHYLCWAKRVVENVWRMWCETKLNESEQRKQCEWQREEEPKIQL